MATPTAIYQTYNQVGIREDLEDIIYDITPMDTYFFSHAGRKTAKQQRHDWQRDTLAAPNSANAYIEGDDFSGQVLTATQKLSNYCQISRKDIVVSRSANKVNTAGRKEELAYQLVRKGKELKRDIESIALSNNNSSAGTSSSPKTTGGAETWIYTVNHVSASGQTTNTTPAPVGGLPATTGTDGTAATWAEADLKNMLLQAWSRGGETDIILMPPTLKQNKFDTFTGVATRFRNVNAGQQADIVGSADVYVSSYGSHKAVLSRYMRASAVLALDMSTWAIAWLDGIHMEQIAKSGDSEKRMMVCEYTVVCNSPEANTKETAIS